MHSRLPVQQLVLDQNYRRDGGEGAELAVDGCLQNDTRTEHHGYPQWKHIQVVSKAGGSEPAAQDDDDRQPIAACVEERGLETRCEAVEIFGQPHVVFGAVGTSEMVMDSQLSDEPVKEQASGAHPGSSREVGAGEEQ